jgi:hypothetical protein
VTHATAVTPPTNTDTSPYWWPGDTVVSECWNPISSGFLYNSMPGLETTGQGGIYSFLYGVAATDPVFIAYQRSYDNGSWSGAQANAISTQSFNGWGMSWSDWYSDTGMGAANNASSGISGDGSTLVYGRAYNGSQVHYGWYQYMNIQGTPTGTPGYNTGVVCSSSLAMWNYEAGYGQVNARTYYNGPINNGANALWNAVQNDCNTTTGWFSSFGSFFTNLGWSALCVGVNDWSEGVCGQAADQMVNCFADNNCGQSNYHNYSQKQWQGALSNGAQAIGISPDDVACWGDNNGSSSTNACTGAGSSVWGADGNQTVQWNSGGNSYYCWD